MTILKIAAIFLLILVIAILIFGLMRTKKTQTSKNQDAFIAGALPSPSLDGEYKGTVTGYNGPWRGKEFSASQSSGINRFEDEPGIMNKRHPFKTSTGQGLRDKNVQVLKIDYNTTGNAFWIRPVLDEVVQVGDGQYLGKIHYRLLPGFSIAVGYFRLTKP